MVAQPPGKDTTQHTPGPLAIQGPSIDAPATRGEVGDYAILDADGCIIGEAYRVVGPGTERPAEANARLWAAAPDLAAELEAIDVIYSEEDRWWLELRSQDGKSGAFPLSPNMGPIARSSIGQWKAERAAAIKKARGQS